MRNHFPVARRELLKLSAFVFGTGLLANLTDSQANSATKSETITAFKTLDKDATPDLVLEELLAGNKRFVENKSEIPNQDYDRLKEVSTEQKPLVSIISCSDSRVPLSVIFDRGIGDLFVVRDAGNIATPEEIGSIEYGAFVLSTPLVMVLGHEKCGAVQAALAGKPLPGQIGSIVAAIKPAIDRASQNESEEFYVETIKRNVMLQRQNLQSSPLLFDLVEQDKLKIVGAYYSLKTGEVSLIT